MRTSMIAALLRALLCFLVPAVPVYAFQCESGQAELTLRYIGLAYDGRTETYQVEGFGTSTLALSELPGKHGPGTLNLYFVVGSSVIKLDYLDKVEPIGSAFFQKALAGGEMMVYIHTSDVGLPPKVDFMGHYVGWNITFDVAPLAGHEPSKSRLTTMQMYMQATDKDGKVTTLFDTRKPCKK